MRVPCLVVASLLLAAGLCPSPVLAQSYRGAADISRSSQPGQIAAGDIVINEAYPRPLASGSEFIELFNRSAVAFDLRDLTIRDAASAPLRLAEEASPFPPGAYQVIVADGAAFSHRFGGVPYSQPSRWASLNNGGDAIVLESGGIVIDSLFYPGSAVEEGRSLERIDPAAPSDAYNFALSTDALGATPGAQNSQYAPDATAPSLIFVKAVGDNELTLHFSEPVQSAAIPPASIRLETLAAERVEPLGPDALKAWFPQAVTGAAVRVGAVSDLRGNASESLAAPIYYRPEARDLVVNEILYEPLSDAYDGLPNQTEFIELANRSGRRVYLDGLYRTRDPDESGDADTVRTADRFLGLDPDGYALFAAAPMEHESALVAAWKGLGLRNDGDRVRIHGEDGEALDDIRYDPSWHHPDVLETRGVTLERIDPDANGNDPQNWTSSAAPEGGTPGRPNSARIAAAPSPAGQGIQISPNPFSPDRDGVDDIARIRCVFSSGVSRVRARVFDLAGNEVRELVGSRLVAESVELLWDGRDHADRRLQTGVYIVLVEAWDARDQVMETFKAPLALARRY